MKNINNMEIALIIYLIGYIWAYYIARKNCRSWVESEDYGWKEIGGNLIFSLPSFILVIIYYVFNPPKWL